MLPYIPERISKHKARYPKAIEPVYDGTQKELPFVWDLPGSKREHIFDFRIGLRLLISRDKLPIFKTIMTGVHFSASVIENTNIYSILMKVTEIAGPQKASERLCEYSLIYFQQVSGISKDHPGIRFMGFSPEKGIPHWFIEE